MTWNLTVFGRSVFKVSIHNCVIQYNCAHKHIYFVCISCRVYIERAYTFQIYREGRWKWKFRRERALNSHSQFHGGWRKIWLEGNANKELAMRRVVWDHLIYGWGEHEKNSNMFCINEKKMVTFCNTCHLFKTTLASHSWPNLFPFSSKKH